MAYNITVKQLYKNYFSIPIRELEDDADGISMAEIKQMQIWITDNRTDHAYMYDGIFFFKSESDKANFLLMWR